VLVLPAFFGEMGHFFTMVILPEQLAFLEGIGAGEMMLVFIVVLVLFGGQKLPEFARGLGKSMREFKKAAAGVEDEFKRAMEDDERKNFTPAPAPKAIEPAAPYNPDNLPPEALDPVVSAADYPAPTMDSIPPPPLIPLGTAVPAAVEPEPPVAASGAAEPLSTPQAAAPTPTGAPAGNRTRDDYS